MEAAALLLTFIHWADNNWFSILQTTAHTNIVLLRGHHSQSVHIGDKLSCKKNSSFHYEHTTPTQPVLKKQILSRSLIIYRPTCITIAGMEECKKSRAGAEQLCIPTWEH